MPSRLSAAWRRVAALLLTAGLLLSPGATGAAVPAAAHTFPETGQTVSGDFWTYWQQNGGLAQFGYPISGELSQVSQLNGKTYIMQYFERAVFERHPENAGTPFAVLLSQLGTYRYRAQYGAAGAPGQQPSTTNPEHFAETGHTLGGPFRAYWEQHGGLARFGFPISDEFIEVSPLNGKPYTVQYFERSVFELHPENAGTPFAVLLSQLGTFRFRDMFPGGSPPTPAPAPPPVPGSSAGDWPMYGHDPSRTDANTAETLLNAGTARALVARWQVQLSDNATPSSSSPIVAGGRVYVGSSALSGPNFFALDSQTGAVVWQADIGHAASECDDVGIGATPAISGTVVVAGGGDGAYYGLDAATGQTLWRDPLDVGPSGFAWESPLVAGGRAYLGVSSHCDNPSVRGAVRAVDLQTGALLGEQAFVPEGQAGAGIWNSPALSPDGQTLVVATGEDFNGYDGPYNRAMLTLDPVSLAIRQGNKQGGTSGDQDWGVTPIVFPGGGGRTFIAAAHKNGHVYAYDLAHVDAGPVWDVAAGLTIGALGAYDGADGILYVAGSHGLLYAFDPATGNQPHTPIVAGTTHGNVALAGGLLFANTGTQGLRIFDAATGEPVATYVPDHAGRSYSGVTVANGFVYWQSGQYLNAWSVPATP